MVAAGDFGSEPSTRREAYGKTMKELFFALLFGMSTVAMATQDRPVMTGGVLYAYLKEAPLSSPAYGASIGYIAAVADIQAIRTAKFRTAVLEDKVATPEEQRKALLTYAPFGVCMPSEATQGLAVAAVRNWLAANPQRWKEQASIVVEDALREAFPCKTAEDFLK
jgi:hypothetical protein